MPPADAADPADRRDGPGVGLETRTRAGEGAFEGALDPAALLARAAVENPTKLAIVESGGRSVTWAELDDEVGRVATGLGASGILAGHRVMIAASNRIEFVTTYLGTLRAQAIAVPVNPRATAHELARLLHDCGARMIVADGDTVTTVREAAVLLAADSSPVAERIRVVVIGSTLRPGERSYDHLRADSGRPVPAPTDPRPSQPGTQTSEYPEVSSPPSQGAGGGYMEILLVIAILWLVGNLVYEVAPAVREGYRWARINLQLMPCILVVCIGLIVSAYIWGKAQRHSARTHALRSGHPSRRHPVTGNQFQHLGPIVASVGIKFQL